MAVSSAPRARVYQRLVRRNRVVALLRWVVPTVGALVLLVVVGGIVLAGLSQRFGFSNIRIDRDNLVVDTPELTSTTEDGTVYALSATSAKVSITQSDIVDMVEARFTATAPSGDLMIATAAGAQLQTTDQLLEVPGTATLESNGGLSGTLDAVFLDIMNWRMTAAGKVDLTLPDGTHIESDGMTYDRETRHFTFTRVKLQIPMLPGEAP
ncbi:MAG: hypothetical protein ACO1OG_11420 [Devosia sp.]